MSCPSIAIHSFSFLVFCLSFHPVCGLLSCVLVACILIACTLCILLASLHTILLAASVGNEGTYAKIVMERGLLDQNSTELAASTPSSKAKYYSMTIPNDNWHRDSVELEGQCCSQSSPVIVAPLLHCCPSRLPKRVLAVPGSSNLTPGSGSRL
ncbi:hypothetical protein CC79DRAFT_85514 [Sarocladium strictum]